MGTYYNRRFRHFEVALLLALAVTLLWGASSADRQETLSRKLIRLHVIANSDSEADQALKLEVRDAVVAQATSLLEQSKDREDAWRRLEAALPELRRTAARVCGGRYPVQATLTTAEFPLKEYDGFTLPAGRYPALRVIIGEGAGRNWWCVVYPPLCTAACTDLEGAAIDAGLAQDEVKLITEQEGYTLRFRAVELWQQVRRWVGK